MKKKKPQEGAEGDVRVRALLNICKQFERMSNSDLIRIVEAMDEYEWPEEVPGKPDGWEAMSLSDRHMWTGPIIQYITMRVGNKANLRHYHKTKFGKTDQEFEDWWDSYSLLSLREQQEELNKSYSRSHCGDHKRYYCGLFIEAILFFALGLLTALLLR